MRTQNSSAGAATPDAGTRAEKKSVGTKSNSTLNFLIGLCAVLMLSFVAIELQTPIVQREFIVKVKDDFTMESNMDRFRIEKPKPEPRKTTQPKNQQVSDKKVNKIKPPVIVDDNQPEPKEVIEPSSNNAAEDLNASI